MLRQAIRQTKLTKPQKEYIHKLVRVDQAGELGADYIYAGQHLVFSHTKPSLAPLIKHMWDQEVHHHNTFDYIQAESRVRPSFFTPVWRAAAFGLGVGTALMGKEAAMACTEAVETVIGGHYNSQLRWLHQNFPENTPGEEMTELKHTIKQFRDDELEHLDTAVENDSQKAVPYVLLTETIKAGCRGAIWIAERA
ncbi:5-demethoxyubiquinone hydroxylase, mitochondrial [Trichomonascus vanleenenianus]|uniref:putative monooxygenase CAT5 n=1 Tax=Trichomonascus vanleenenianus TaxID=2268995 RepID=UPI003ECB074E